MWTYNIVDSDKYVFTYEGSRNLIMCSPSRYSCMLEAVEQIKACADYSVKFFTFMPHNMVYVIDSEGIVMKLEIKDE